MNRLIGILFFCLTCSACASVEMPQARVEEPGWITERRAEYLASSETPVSVNATRADNSIRYENEAQMNEVLEKREELLEQARALDGDDRLSTEEFIEAGRERTSPPQ